MRATFAQNILTQKRLLWLKIWESELMLLSPPQVTNGCPGLLSRARAGMLGTDASIESVP